MSPSVGNAHTASGHLLPPQPVGAYLLTSSRLRRLWSSLPGVPGWCVSTEGAMPRLRSSLASSHVGTSPGRGTCHTSLHRHASAASNRLLPAHPVRCLSREGPLRQAPYSTTSLAPPPAVLPTCVPFSATQEGPVSRLPSTCIPTSPPAVLPTCALIPCNSEGARATLPLHQRAHIPPRLYHGDSTAARVGSCQLQEIIIPASPRYIHARLSFYQPPTFAAARLGSWSFRRVMPRTRYYLCTLLHARFYLSSF